MLSLAGIPATAGFIGKFRLIEAAADGGYTWLGIVIVIGSMISLAYYLPVVAAMWRDEARRARRRPAPIPCTGRAALAGGAPDADAPTPRTGGWETQLVAAVMGARDPRLRHHPAAALRPRRRRRRRHRPAPRSARARSSPIGQTLRRAHHRQGRLRRPRRRRARRRRGRGPGQGRADRDRPGHPAEVPREHPQRAADRRASSPAGAGRRAATGSTGPAAEITVADVLRAVEGPLASIRGDRARDARRTRARPPRCRGCGSRCARTCARCSRASRSPTSPQASCRANVAGAHRRPGRLGQALTGAARAGRARSTTTSPSRELERLGLAARHLRAERARRRRG